MKQPPQRAPSSTYYPPLKCNKPDCRSHPAPTLKSGATHSYQPRRQLLPQGYGSLPLSFEPNQGQTDSSVNFISHGAGYTVFLAGNAAVLSLQSHDDGYRLLQKMDARTRKRFESRRFYRLSPRFHRPTKADVIRVAIMGANPSANAQPLDQLPGKVRYFVGGEPVATRDWAMVLLAYRHSLRGSEVCGLKLSDIDLKVSSISIRRLKGSLQTVQPLYPHRGQPLLDEVNALRSWFREPEHDGSDYLLTS